METIIAGIRRICLYVILFYFTVLLLSKIDKSAGSTCIKEYNSPITSADSSPDRIALHVKRGDIIIDTFVSLNDVIMIQVNQGYLDGCAAYVRDGELHVEERLIDIKRKIEATSYPQMCQTNRREMVNTLYIEKYNWCEKIVTLDDELESQVTESFRDCIEQHLDH